MDFRILGPLEVLDEGRAVALGGSRQRALLALLLLNLNETLSIDRLIDELWGEQRQAPPARRVHVQISRLRKALVPPRARADGDGLVVTRDHGYALCSIPSGSTRTASSGCSPRAAASSPPAARSAPSGAFERALALWRGAPLADLAYEPFAQAEIGRLDELRSAALEQHIEADLALGRHADVVGRLPALIRDYPHREQLRGQLMLALYRCDRQADALQAYQDARHELVEELGIEPGERLRDLHRAILAQDPALVAAGATAPRPRHGARDSRRRPAPPARDRRGRELAGSRRSPSAPDPSRCTRVLASCEAMFAAVFESHGGTVERFDGDARVGMFGLRALHEDDALRAVRAALELARGRRRRRLGIEPGEVYVGAGARGRDVRDRRRDAVAAQAREAADDGEILLGELTHRLVAPHVVAEPLEPAPPCEAARQAIRAFRLLDAAPGEPGWPVRAATPFDRPRDGARQLRELLSDASTRRAGVPRWPRSSGRRGSASRGSRASSSTRSRRRATVAVGRCLSYGDGITYRPLAEIVRQLPGGDPARRVAEILAGDERADADRAARARRDRARRGAGAADGDVLGGAPPARGARAASGRSWW